MSRLKMTATVVEQICIGTDIYDMTIAAPEIAESAVSGQFVSLYSSDSAHMLPRPVSLCDIDRENGLLRLVYRIVGYGTNEFSKLRPGDKIDVMGPLGNGFTLMQKKAILVGGGIGIPPMLQLAKELKAEKSIVLGYRDELFLNEEFAPYGDVYISTEDGSSGIRGNVIDAINQYNISGDVIYACGPLPMLKGVKAYAMERRLICQISMEEKMACGIGACLACVCSTSETDEHSNVHNKRICKDGPVFFAEEVEL